MNKKYTVFCLVMIICWSSVIFCATSSWTAPDLGVSGHWKGTGHIIVSWCTQDELLFDLRIGEDGQVTGKVGDAAIVNGHLFRRSSLMRRMGNGEYLIRAHLDGDVVKADRVRRESVSLMLDVKKETLEGEMNTSGSKCGGRERMYLKVVDIVLVPVYDLK